MFKFFDILKKKLPKEPLHYKILKYNSGNEEFDRLLQHVAFYYEDSIIGAMNEKRNANIEEQYWSVNVYHRFQVYREQHFPINFALIFKMKFAGFDSATSNIAQLEFSDVKFIYTLGIEKDEFTKEYVAQRAIVAARALSEHDLISLYESMAPTFRDQMMTYFLAKTFGIYEKHKEALYYPKELNPSNRIQLKKEDRNSDMRVIPYREVPIHDKQFMTVLVKQHVSELLNKNKCPVKTHSHLTVSNIVAVRCYTGNFGTYLRSLTLNVLNDEQSKNGNIVIPIKFMDVHYPITGKHDIVLNKTYMCEMSHKELLDHEDNLLENAVNKLLDINGIAKNFSAAIILDDKIKEINIVRAKQATNVKLIRNNEDLDNL